MFKVSSLNIGYVPNSSYLNAPGDIRRFVHYANSKKIKFEIADPEKKYDVVVVSERADLSVWSRYQDGALIYDFIDSYLAIPRTNIKGILRGLAKFVTNQSRYLQLDHWKAIELMCQRSNAVICTTEEQKKDINRFCTNVHVILDSHANVTTTNKQTYESSKPFRLVWEGLPHTLDSLMVIKRALKKISTQYPIELYILTDTEYYRFLGMYGRTNTLKIAQQIMPNIKLIEWRAETAAEIICSCDLAIIPIDLSEPFALGKPENKLILFWRMGMPVITSATPAYLRAMSSAGLTMTCSNMDEWELALCRYISDESARQQAAKFGQKCVEEFYSESELIAKWDAVFESVFT
jgi:glycosyltransferase involved in cell wall biosynthesis